MNFISLFCASAVLGYSPSQAYIEVEMFDTSQSSTKPAGECMSEADSPLKNEQDLRMDGSWGKTRPCACQRTMSAINSFWTASLNGTQTIRQVQILTNENENFAGASIFIGNNLCHEVSSTLTSKEWQLFQCQGDGARGDSIKI